MPGPGNGCRQTSSSSMPMIEPSARTSSKHEIAWTRGGKVDPSDKREYGKAVIKIAPGSRLFDGLADQLTVWMSHGDQLSAIPPGFHPVAVTSTAPFAAVEKEEEQIYGIQFHPEVTHTPQGNVILGNFVLKICKANPNWTMASFIDKEIDRIRSIVGPTAQVVGAVSGGVDSTVAAKIMSKAIGDRFHAILVDNGVMRLNECTTVQKTLQDHLGINLILADASDLFLGRLKGVTDPERKRKIIGNSFIEVFEAEAAKIEAKVEQEGRGKIEFLLQGTLYPDVIESISFKGPSATIKTHHNVGGLLDDMKLKVIEPLRELFKGM
ncbi:hypothetical protein BDK51DRAFT_33949 [Blyttiomyces helicus]|uniref:GMPS ATP-PPase domain-containing protein n=1 Tax=Blyttiomyces helicus TaxID=388810 RepID=A0A4P9WLC9_9FUNG|nr:hypothetical protein BDK51DRAFT_33949 [Blyttiomyces helicus]|eukprot:RKO91456.1 hypothetical protein BDK51DRAFT_33949 [Blyttiomyces helicus]